jgi:hypothetical protein
MEAGSFFEERSMISCRTIAFTNLLGDSGLTTLKKVKGHICVLFTHFSILLCGIFHNHLFIIYFIG